MLDARVRRLRRGMGKQSTHAQIIETATIRSSFTRSMPLFVDSNENFSQSTAIDTPCTVD